MTEPKQPTKPLKREIWELANKMLEELKTLVGVTPDEVEPEKERVAREFFIGFLTTARTEGFKAGVAEERGRVKQIAADVYNFDENVGGYLDERSFLEKLNLTPPPTKEGEANHE